MPGHPDGQNYAIWRGPLFSVSTAFALSAANPFTTQGQITNFASFVLLVAPTSPGGVTAEVSFFADAAFTQSVGDFQWQIPHDRDLHVIVPGLGNYVKVLVTTTDAGASNAVIAAYPTNTPADKPMYQRHDNFISGSGVSIPAASTLIFPLIHVMSGPGQMYVQDLTASTKLFFSVILINIDGTNGPILINEPAPVTFDHKTFEAPSQALAMKIQNTDGVAHTASYVLCVNVR